MNDNSLLRDEQTLRIMCSESNFWVKYGRFW